MHITTLILCNLFSWSDFLDFALLPYKRTILAIEVLIRAICLKPGSCGPQQQCAKLAADYFSKYTSTSVTKRDAIYKFASGSIVTAIYAAAQFTHAQIFMTLCLEISMTTARGNTIFLLAGTLTLTSDELFESREDCRFSAHLRCGPQAGVGLPKTPEPNHLLRCLGQ